ncbi:MAG: carboxypeptidase-like regulatory domain-containing protein [Pyrinomonadaceae bacterium]
MNGQEFDINALRIASPCSVGWESMTGDERTRHCALCSLNVYNISELTQNGVERLIQQREGRLCIRMYRRADGTVLTQDCPVGLRAIKKRATRFVGATLATVLGLFSISYGQEKERDKIKTPEVVGEKIKDINQKIELSGTVYDLNGAVIAGVPLKLIRVEDKKVLNINTDEYGDFSFKDVPKGVYDLEITGILGFANSTYKNLDVNGSEKIKVILSVGMETVGILAIDDLPIIDLMPISITMEVLPRIPEKNRPK